MLRWLICAIAILGFWLSNPDPACARLEQHVEAPGRVLYKSLLKLRDSNRDTWQVVLFKWVENGCVTDLDLRLVGFPGRAEFQHPQNLVLAAGNRLWQAPDRYATEAPTPNIGQFDLTEILPELPSASAVELTLPTTEMLTLKVPMSAIAEWQVVRRQSQ
ncbi:MAG: DUF3122 domain-containing protein [Cyanobacteria bacterium J06641_5]